MVNVRPTNGTDPVTDVVGLTINGGSNQSVPSTCSIAPSGNPAVRGDGNVLLGGDSRFFRSTSNDTVPGSPQNPRFYLTNDVSTSGGLNNTTTVNDLWASQAATDARAVSTYISTFTSSGGCSEIALTYCSASTVSYANDSVQNLQGTGGLNFFTVSSFGSNVKLNFSGTSNDFFVFNVPTASIVTNQGWTISGLDPSQIIFNIIGNTNGANAADLILNSGANILGTFLVNSNTNATCSAGGGGAGNACNGGTVQMADNTSLFGSLIVINNANEQAISFGTNSVINGKPFNPTRLRRVPGPIPVLGGVAAFGWSRRLRRRLKTSRSAVTA